jgi:archaellum component FlaC
MSVALKLYEQLTEAADDRERFRLIADAIGALEDAWPRPGEVARAGDVRESELRLQKEIETIRKEIEVVRKEIAEVDGRLRKEIEVVRKETEQVRLETERVRGEIRASETRLQQALHRQTFWIIGAVGAVVGLIRLLDAMFP